MPLTRFAYPLLLVCSKALACELPALALIPESVGDEVVSVLQDVRRYSDSIIEYTTCLKAELESAGGDAAPPLVRSIIVARNNHAVAEHKVITARYAERIGPIANLALADYLDGESRDCLLGDSVERTGVVNTGAVIFFSRRGQAYLNVLEAACPELERQFFVGNQSATGLSASPGGRGVTTDTPLASRVCDHDDIFPYREGSARRVVGCQLGRFYSVAEEQALQILDAFQNPPATAEAAGDAL